ncbi:hypothetical protein XH88_18670 [Bradyrhizobium sp. CCBAU 51627]|nr:hypothetical protein [Bradyrhizobium sp. CCBAU 51627]
MGRVGEGVSGAYAFALEIADIVAMSAAMPAVADLAIIFPPRMSANDCLLLLACAPKSAHLIKMEKYPADNVPAIINASISSIVMKRVHGYYR